MDPSSLIIVQVFAALGTVLGAFLLIFKVIIPVAKAIGGFFISVRDFLRDWSGEDPRSGRDRVPGVMERLNEIDGQLKNNGGASVKDAVDRIEIHVGEIHDKIHQVDQRLEEGDKKFDAIENRLKKLEDKI